MTVLKKMLIDLNQERKSFRMRAQTELVAFEAYKFKSFQCFYHSLCKFIACFLCETFR